MHLTRTLMLALAIGCCTFAASFANAGTMAPDGGTTMHLQNTTNLPGAVKPRVVMLGDSITKGVRPGVKPAETFAARLQLALRADGIAVEIINAGIGGERTDQAISRLTPDVIARKPAVVTVMYGTNDSYVDHGKNASRLTISQYRANLETIVAQLRAAGIIPVLMTEPRWGRTATVNGAVEHPNVRLEEYVKVCRAVAAAQQVPLVDHFKLWTDAETSGTDIGGWTTDQCHPNPEGHRILAAAILPVLKTILQAPANQVRAGNQTAALDYTVRLDILSEGFDAQTQWFQPRVGIIPPATAVITLTRSVLSGSDIFTAIRSLQSDDFGKSWSAPVSHEATLGRRQEADGTEVVICDATPAWHSASGKLLATGHTARYLGDHLAPNPRRRETPYTVYDPATHTWSPWRILDLPDAAEKFFNAGAGCTQRVDLENGDILLPVYFLPRALAGDSRRNCYRATVVRCRFDGVTLRYVEHGDELSCPDPRGFCEPSLTRFNGRFYLTLRNDVRGYVTVSQDGLHFEKPIPWTFDDGRELGSYNTQQHWIAHSDGLFLVYTRRGANNDHVFRNRAPLFMAQVDPERLCVRRATERILLPEKGAQFGNFGVVTASATESWVVDAEGMQGDAEKPMDLIRTIKRGANNRLYLCRIQWSRPNRLFTLVSQ